MVRVTIRPLDALDAPICDAIVAGLPTWFANADGIAECAIAVRDHDGLVAVERDEVVGFVTFEQRTRAGWEITWIAVRADRRTRGVGSALVEELGSVLPADADVLFVKDVVGSRGRPWSRVHGDAGVLPGPRLPPDGRARYLGPREPLPAARAPPHVSARLNPLRPWRRGTSCISCRCRTGRARSVAPSR